MSAVMEEVTRKIRNQQGKEHSRVWHTGEHVLEFLGKCPQYAELISADLDNPEMSLTNFEKAIAKAARANGGGLGGKDADAVLRKFYGIPAEGEDASKSAPTPAPVSKQAAPEVGGVHVDLSDFL